MTFRAVAWTELIDPGGALVPITAVEDVSITTSGDSVRVPEDTPVLVGYGAIIPDASAVRAQLQSPSLERSNYPDFSPIRAAALWGDPPRIALDLMSTRDLDVAEDLQAYVESDPAAAAQHYVVAFLATAPPQPVNGRILRIRGTASIAQAVGAYASGNITLDQRLQVGTYQLVGARVVSSDGVLARIILTGEGPRPGVPVVAGQGDQDFDQFRSGKMGVWGTFAHDQLPRLEMLGGTATSQTLFLDLIRQGG